MGALFFGLGARTLDALLTGAAIGCVVGMFPVLRHPQTDQRLIESPLHVGAFLGLLSGIATGLLSGTWAIGFMFFMIGMVSGALALLTTHGQRA